MVPVSSHICASKDRCVNFKSTINIDRPRSPFERYIRVFNAACIAPMAIRLGQLYLRRFMHTHARTFSLSVTFLDVAVYQVSVAKPRRVARKRDPIN